MLVYHGSNVAVEKPIIVIPNRTLDFGSGFYTTINWEQAQSFAHNVVDRNDGLGIPTISIYEIDFEKLVLELSVLQFDQPDDKWLDFVYANRTAKYAGEQYDVIFGPVANDTVYRVLRLFENGDIDRETVIKKLKVTALFNQMTFCTERAIAELRFVASEAVSNG